MGAEAVSGTSEFAPISKFIRPGARLAFSLNSFSAGRPGAARAFGAGPKPPAP